MPAIILVSSLAFILIYGIAKLNLEESKRARANKTKIALIQKSFNKICNLKNSSGSKRTCFRGRSRKARWYFQSFSLESDSVIASFRLWNFFNTRRIFSWKRFKGQSVSLGIRRRRRTFLSLSGNWIHDDRSKKNRAGKFFQQKNGNHNSGQADKRAGALKPQMDNNRSNVC